jgi:hypothetical protein
MVKGASLDSVLGSSRRVMSILLTLGNTMSEGRRKVLQLANLGTKGKQLAGY